VREQEARGVDETLPQAIILTKDFQTTISSSRGSITIFESVGHEVFVDANDFLF
jgi:hypothetical protein